MDRSRWFRFQNILTRMTDPAEFKLLSTKRARGQSRTGLHCLVTFVLCAIMTQFSSPPHSVGSFIVVTGNLIPSCWHIEPNSSSLWAQVAASSPFFQFVKLLFKLISRKSWAITMEFHREIPHLLLTTKPIKRQTRVLQNVTAMTTDQETTVSKLALSSSQSTKSGKSVAKICNNNDIPFWAEQGRRRRRRIDRSHGTQKADRAKRRRKKRIMSKNSNKS